MMTIGMLKIVFAGLFFALAAIMLVVWMSGVQHRHAQHHRACRAAHRPQRHAGRAAA